jgi:Na+/melibiose symporter-like transporter
MADTPEWLQHTNTDLEAAKRDSVTEIETPTSQELSNNNQNSEDTPKRSFRCSCGAALILMISAAFLGIFIFSAIMQNNDSDSVLWLLFYSLSAATAAMFMLHYLCCFPQKVFYVLTVGMAVWAIVMVIITSLKFKDTAKGADREYREELGYELGGTALSLLSSLYHALMVVCCTNKNKKDDE